MERADGVSPSASNPVYTIVVRRGDGPSDPYSAQPTSSVVIWGTPRIPFRALLLAGLRKRPNMCMCVRLDATIR